MPDFITNYLIAHGVSRDSTIWFWGKLLSISALIVAGVVDVNYWSTYLGVHIPEVGLHWIQVIAVAILYLSGKYDTSPLYDKHTAPVVAEVIAQDETTKS